MDFTRTFVALQIGPPAQQVLQRLVERLQKRFPRVRWSNASQHHLTLKFIGEVDNRELPGLCAKVEQVCREFKPFAVEVQGIGTFPGSGESKLVLSAGQLTQPPKVIWAGATDPGGELQEIHRKIDASTLELGVPAETRKFTPHITLGFVRGEVEVEELATVLAEEQSTVDSIFDAEEICLMGSLKQNRQIVYEPIHKVELR